MIELTQEELKRRFSDKIFGQISETADTLGLECYVVGGYVRDIFLERPSKDIDVVVVGSGIEMAQALGKHLGKGAHVSVFKNFGTAQVKYHGVEVEFVGARKESYQRDSRKPIVEDGTLEDDQNRRDFTINALAVCLNKDRFGELVDPFGGMNDLKEKTIRTPLDPDITFSDDPLRMMRCIRFATQLGFYIDDETFESLCRNRERIKIISRERIADELNKILLSPVPSKGFIDLERSGLLALIFPELMELQGVETRNGRAHKDNFYHTLEVLDNISRHTDNLWLRWAALLHDIAKPLCRSVGPDGAAHFKGHNQRGAQLARVILRRLKAPAYLVDGAVGLIAVHDAPLPADDVGILKLLNRSGAIFLRRLCALKYADLDAHANTPEVAARRADVAAFERRMNELAKTGCYTMRQLAVNGADLMDIGIPAGPGVGATLQTLLNDVMEGTLPNEREALLAAAVK